MIGLLSVIAGRVRAAAGIVDPYWDSVSALLRFDSRGVVNDKSGTSAWAGLNATAVADALAFSGYSMRLTGTGYAHNVTGDTAHTLTTATAWTVEGWVRLDDSSILQGLFFCGDPSSNDYRIQVGMSGTTRSVSLYLQGATGTGVTVNSGAVLLSSGVRHHIAACRDGNTLRLFIDGELVGTGSFGAAMLARSSCRIGTTRSGGTMIFSTGNYDDWRITRGVARYSASFMPPTGPLPAS